MTSRARRVVLLHVRDERPHAERYQQLLDELNDAALAALRAAGWRPELVATAHAERATVLARARSADAIVIMGGEDVDPRLYGGRTDYPGSGGHEPRSDATLIAVTLDAIAREAPLLAICRGHQLLNVALGGTLVEHLDGHRDPGAEVFVQTPLQDVAAPLAAAPLPPDAVRCTHHQAIDRLADGLRVLALAQDGVVEAVAHETAPVLGVQWHPEHPQVAAAQLPALLDVVAALRPTAVPR